MTEPTPVDLEGQLTLDDAEAEAEPDPGNAGPDQWSTDLEESDRDRAYGLVNDVAVDLPEPAPDVTADDGGA